MTDKTLLSEFAALKATHERLCDRAMQLQQQYDELHDRAGFLRLEHEETIGYRQHAEQEVSRLRRVLISIATCAREGILHMKQVAQENEDPLSAQLCDECLASLSEFVAE